MSCLPGQAVDVAIIRRYESMRQRWCQGDAHGGDRLGLAVLLARGMSAWLRQQAQLGPVAAAPEDPAPRSRVEERAGAAVLPGDMRAEVARMLASMAIESVESAKECDVG